MGEEHLNYFSQKEKGFMSRFKNFRTQALTPLIRVLLKMGFTADMLSYIGLFSLGGFVYFVVSHPLIAVCFLVFHLFLDALDGPLARISGNDNDSGAFTDILCDHTGLIVVVVSLVWSNLVHPVIALIYVYVYTLLVVFLTIRNTVHIPIKATVRPTYPLYLLYFLFAVWHINYIDIGLYIGTFFMIPSLIMSYFTIKTYLKGK